MGHYEQMSYGDYNFDTDGIHAYYYYYYVVDDAR